MSTTAMAIPLAQNTKADLRELAILLRQEVTDDVMSPPMILDPKSVEELDGLMEEEIGGEICRCLEECGCDIKSVDPVTTESARGKMFVLTDWSGERRYGLVIDLEGAVIRTFHLTAKAGSLLLAA